MVWWCRSRGIIVRQTDMYGRTDRARERQNIDCGCLVGQPGGEQGIVCTPLCRELRQERGFPKLPGICDCTCIHILAWTDSCGISPGISSCEHERWRFPTELKANKSVCLSSSRDRLSLPTDQAQLVASVCFSILTTKIQDPPCQQPSNV